MMYIITAFLFVHRLFQNNSPGSGASRLCSPWWAESVLPVVLVAYVDVECKCEFVSFIFVHYRVCKLGVGYVICRFLGGFRRSSSLLDLLDLVGLPFSVDYYVWFLAGADIRFPLRSPMSAPAMLLRFAVQCLPFVHQVRHVQVTE
jgi:hypothetical protein